MRRLGGPNGQRNVLGRWQDRREDRLEAPYGQARQASWAGIVGLVTALVVFVALILYAFLWVQQETEGDGSDPTPVCEERSVDVATCPVP